MMTGTIEIAVIGTIASVTIAEIMTIADQMIVNKAAAEPETWTWPSMPVPMPQKCRLETMQGFLKFAPWRGMVPDGGLKAI